MDIASPSKVFAGIGEFMAQGLGVGFTREMRGVERDIRDAMPTAGAVMPANYTATDGGRIPRTEDASGAVGVQVTQNFYTDAGDYSKQQREAAKQFRLVARAIS
jgi:hypothetical protein